MRAAVVRLARVDRMLAGWILVSMALAVAAAVFTSRPAGVSGQTGPALTPPSEELEEAAAEVKVSVSPFMGGAKSTISAPATVRVLDVSTQESRPSRRRLPPSPTAADRFIEATQGGQPLVGVQISVGFTGRGTLLGSLIRAQTAQVCMPAGMKPPGVGLEDLIVSPGHRIDARLDGQRVCVDFVFTEAGTFVVGVRTQPVIPEFAAFYAATGGQATWGPCLTRGFFAAVGPAGTIVEVSPGAGLYVQACANGVLGYSAGLAGTGYEIQPVLATHWVRSEDGQFAGADPPAADTGDGRYFPQTGHNVRGAFLTTFLALGGVEVAGYPITEALAAGPGFTDQYFQHLKLRMDDGTGEVTVRPVGREFVAMLAATHAAEAKVS